MPEGYLSNPLMLIINSLVGAYIFVLVLRVLLQYTNADSRNPVSSFADANRFFSHERATECLGGFYLEFDRTY